MLYFKLDAICPFSISDTALVSPQPGHGILNVTKNGHVLTLKKFNVRASPITRSTIRIFLFTKVSKNH